MINHDRVGIYPGTFDPVTFGHLDIIERSLFVVDKLYVAVATDSLKHTLFTVQERQNIIKDELIRNNFDLSKIEVVNFSGLLVEYAKIIDASVIIRGIRAVSDFEFEFQMSCMNSMLSKNLQTIFLPASERMQLVSSRIVKEVVRLGGDVHNFASDSVQQKIRNKYAE